MIEEMSVYSPLKVIQVRGRRRHKIREAFPEFTSDMDDRMRMLVNCWVRDFGQHKGVQELIVLSNDAAGPVEACRYKV